MKACIYTVVSLGWLEISGFRLSFQENGPLKALGE